MTVPDRLQYRRGVKLPPGAIYVGRPSKYGNPFKVGASYTPEDWQYAVLCAMNKGVEGLASVKIIGQQSAVDAFAYWLFETPSVFLAAFDELPGHDLACWCKPRTPCHADYLIGLVNA